jgi:hypothetical protein
MHLVPCCWLPAIVAAGFVLAIVGPAVAQPKEEQPDLQKQIENALKELKKIAPDDPTIRGIDPRDANNPDALRRRLEEIRGQLRNAPGGGFGRRGFGGAMGSRFGAVVAPPPEIVADQLDLPANKGLAVLEVRPDSPAEKAGIRKNDILIEFAGKSVPADTVDFTRDVREHKVGEEVDAVVIRRGKRETIKGIKLAEFEDGGRFGGRIPDLRLPNLPGVRGIGGVAAGNGDSIRVRVQNDEFQVELTNGEVKATLKGTRENGKMTPKEIRIQDGDKVIETQDPSQVPERYRPLLERMAHAVGAGPAIRRE